ncbi:MAG: trigger factor [Candidatus Omnitrophica bacterium]|nr:trigger factor [Candidatus Omnitrophota bacterium]
MKILEQQDTGICTKTVKIEIPTEEIDAELEGVYKEFMENAQVPGFRPGKAPRQIIRMKYGKHLDKEAREKAVETAFKKAMEELALKPVTSPDFSGFDDEEKSEGEDKKDEPIVFEAKFEYAPKVELAEYKDIHPEIPPAEVTEKQIVDSLERLRESNAMYATIDDRAAGENDFVMISSEATIDGEAFKEATSDEFVIEIGSKRYIPGLEDALIGLKIGDKKEFTLTLPEDYPVEERRGKEAVFNIEVKSIREKRLPELDDEFAKDMGNFNTLSELKDRIRETLENSVEERHKQEFRQAIRHELLVRNSFDVPPSMVKARYEYINALHDMELQRAGTSLEDEAKRDEGLLARNEEAAEKEVRLSLILNQIAEQETITVDDNDYQSYIGKIARQAGYDPAQYARRIESQGIQSYYEREALEEKVVDYLEDLAELSDAQKESPDSTGSADQSASDEVQSDE